MLQLTENKIGVGQLFATIVLCMGFSIFSFADFSIQGHYQGKNIYVQSPADEDGFGFCINRVSVNGDVIPVDVYSSAFQINLSDYNIQVGQEVIILFEHDEGCRPKLLNPEALRPKSTFVLDDISCTPDGELTWSTVEESGKLNYLVEQYKWNKWVTVGEVIGIGTANLNEYSFNILPHTGKNLVRLAQVDNTGKKRVTESVSFISSNTAIPELQVVKQEKMIEFLSGTERVKTKYEVFDTYGNIVKKGYNSIIDCSNLAPGVYHVNFDNKNEKVVIR